MKKQVFVALAAALIMSVLPGCGKGKNNQDGNLVGGVVSGLYPGIGGVGTGGSSLSMSNVTGAVSGELPINMGGGNIGAANTFVRSSGGDVVILSLGQAPIMGGTGFTQVPAAIYVNLSSGGIAYFNYYCGGAMPTRAFVNSPLVSGFPGQISMSVTLVTANGCYLAI